MFHRPLIVVILAASMALPVPLPAQNVPPGNTPPADIPAPPPRPWSPIPTVNGYRGLSGLPSAREMQRWMDELQAAWRAGKCDELKEGISRMRSWLLVYGSQLDGLRSRLRSAVNEWQRQDLSREIQETRNLIENIKRQLDWLESQPCPPLPPETPQNARTPGAMGGAPQGAPAVNEPGASQLPSAEPPGSGRSRVGKAPFLKLGPAMEGTYRATNPAGEPSELTIVERGRQMMLLGAGQPIPLKKQGDTYVGTGASLFGKSNLQVQLRMTGGTPQLTATDTQGETYTTNLTPIEPGQ